MAGLHLRVETPRVGLGIAVPGYVNENCRLSCITLQSYDGRLLGSTPRPIESEAAIALDQLTSRLGVQVGMEQNFTIFGKFGDGSSLTPIDKYVLIR